MFSGIPKRTLVFLSELSRNNEKAWFDAHRDDYEQSFIEPAKELVEALAKPLKKLDPKLHAEPRVNGSILRINRDIRFSKDKSPYKTHVAALLWEGEDKHESPAVYLHVSPSEVIIGGGLYAFDEARLDRYRKLVVQEKAGEALAHAVKKLEKAGLSLEGEKSVRPPRGVTPEHPRAELSKHKGLAAARTMKPGGYLYTGELADRAEEIAKAYLPLHAWLRDELCG